MANNTVEKVLNVKLSHPQVIFEAHTDTLNASRPDLKQGLPWLWQRMLGHDLPEPPAS